MKTLMRHCLAFIGLLAACTLEPAQDDNAMDQGNDEEDITNPLYVGKKLVWPGGIPVCWEIADKTVFPVERAAVQDQVGRTWETSTGADFTGWGICKDASTGVRIAISDERPHVNAFGKKLAGMKAGLVLNFTFNNWSTTCSVASGSVANTERCIRNLAVHEFGHVLGFYHEQARTDTNTVTYPTDGGAACSEADDIAAGVTGGVSCGAWDKESVMNYCSTRWINGGVLTAKDIACARKYYPMPPVLPVLPPRPVLPVFPPGPGPF